jgi:hypothetical protein
MAELLNIDLLDFILIFAPLLLNLLLMGGKDKKAVTKQ